jgi:hypothetical protein
MTTRVKLVPLLAAALLAACNGESTTAPGLPSADVAGVYDLTILTFDPQGSLPEVDIKSRLGLAVQPRLFLGTNGIAQLVYQDPNTQLEVSSQGSYSTSPNTVAVIFSDTNYVGFLLSRAMRFQFSSADSTRTLSFDSLDPDGVPLARLTALVPEWADEPLIDPVPGTLHVVFTAE